MLPAHDCWLLCMFVIHCVQISDESRAGGPPSQPLLCEGARSRNSVTPEVRQPTKVLTRLLRGFGDHRHFQTAADGLGDFSERDALFRDCVIATSGKSFFRPFPQRQPVQMGTIQPVHGGPAVEAVADIRGDTFLASQSDQVSDQALLDRVMHLRKPHYRNAHALRSHRRCCLLGSYAGNGRIGLVFLGGEAAGSGGNRRPRSDDQGSVGTNERGAESPNCPAVDLAYFIESREIVNESGVNYAIRGSDSAAKTVQIFNIAPMDLYVYVAADSGQRLCSRIGTR